MPTGRANGASETPRNMIERAADAAMDAAERALTRDGGQLEKILVVIHADGLPEHEDCVTAGRGFEDGEDTVVFLVSEAVAAGRQVGLDVKIIPFGTAGRG